jgi:hypothetical protein
MTDHFKVIQQFISRHIELFNFSEVDIEDFMGKGYYNYICEINTDEIKAQGFGTAFGKVQAFLCSLGEAIERFYFLKQSKYSTTNGFASHTILDLAIENGKRELIERDAFLCHFHTQRKIRDITSDLVSSNVDFQSLMKKVSAAGLNARFGLLRDEDFFCVIANIHPVRSGGIIGLSCSSSLKKAAHKALLESFINSNISASISSLNLEDFLALDEKESHQPVSHLKLGIGSDINSRLLQQFSKKIRIKNPSLHHDHFHIEEFDAHKSLVECPFFVVKVSNPKLQDLYFGKNIELNLQRLREFSGGELLHIPHILA